MVSVAPSLYLLKLTEWHICRNLVFLAQEARHCHSYVFVRAMNDDQAYIDPATMDRTYGASEIEVIIYE